MLSRAISKYIRISPYKLRPIVDVIRGRQLDQALAWLKTVSNRRISPIEKALQAAYANAKNKHKNISSMNSLYIKEIRVDQGPTISYFKPAAMGRASVQKKRMSHLAVVLDEKK